MKLSIPVRICALLLISLTIMSLCGCSSGIKPTEQDVKVIGKVGDFDVTYEELRYLTMNYKNGMETKYNLKIWDDAELTKQYLPELKEAVYTALTANYAILTLCKEAQISIDDTKIKDAVEADIKDYINNIVSEAKAADESLTGSDIEIYKNALDEYYLTDHLLRFITGVDYCQSELLYVYTDDLGIIDGSYDAAYNYVMSDECVHVYHIFIKCDPDATEDERAAAKAEAVAVRNKWVSGEETYDSLVGKYSDDVYMTSSGYYFFKGDMVEEYENAAFALNVGGISDVVEVFGDVSESGSGYYIIQSVAKDEAYVVSHLSSDMMEQYLSAKFYPYINECRDKLTFLPNEYGESLDLAAMK